MASPARKDEDERKLGAAHDHDAEPDTVLTTTEARQGTGPRSMVMVLGVSMILALIAGFAITYWFTSSNQELRSTLPDTGVQAPVDRTPPATPEK